MWRICQLATREGRVIGADRDGGGGSGALRATRLLNCLLPTAYCPLPAAALRPTWAAF